MRKWSVLLIVGLTLSLAACGNVDNAIMDSEVPTSTIEETEALASTETVTSTEAEPTESTEVVPERTLEEIVTEDLGIELQEEDVVKEIDNLYEKGYEIQHADGTSTIDVKYLGLKEVNSMHMRISHVSQDMNIVLNGDGWCRKSSVKQEKGGTNAMTIFIVPQTIEDLNLKDMTDKEIGEINTYGYTPYYDLQRTETEDSYIVTMGFDINVNKVPRHGYGKMINDYKTGKAYDMVVTGSQKYFDLEQAKKIIESAQFFAETEDGELVVIGGEEPEQEVTVVETVEFEGKRTTGTETRYSDGTSDYEVFYAHPDTQKTFHFTLTGLKSGMLPEYKGGWCVCTYYNEQDPNIVYKLYIGIITGVGSYKDMSDDIFMDCMSKDPDISTLQRIENEKDYRVYLAGKKSDLGIEDCTDYNLFIEDYATNQTYKYMVRGIPEMDKEYLLNILNSVEILGLE